MCADGAIGLLTTAPVVSSLMLQGMWHVFQATLNVPEAQEAAAEMAQFLQKRLQ
jgi:hypothetical protein